MATYTFTAGDRAVNDKVLVASTVDTVTLDNATSKIRIISDGTAKIYFTLDGTAPTVSGANCFEIPASLSVDEEVTHTNTVKLISSGTPTYSVIELP